MDFGYVRTSTAEQNTERQLADVKLDKTFTDKISGSIRERPELANMLNQVREGDTIHVHSIDRLARDLRHLQEIIAEVNAMGVALHFHKESMIFDGSDNPMQKLMMQMLGSVAEFERSMINQRNAEGRAIAKAKGVKFGRKPKLTPAQIRKARAERDAGKSMKKIAIDMDVSHMTLYRALAS